MDRTCCQTKTINTLETNTGLKVAVSDGTAGVCGTVSPQTRHRLRKLQHWLISKSCSSTCCSWTAVGLVPHTHTAGSRFPSFRDFNTYNTCTLRAEGISDCLSTVQCCQAAGQLRAVAANATCIHCLLFKLSSVPPLAGFKSTRTQAYALQPRSLSQHGTTTRHN